MIDIYNKENNAVSRVAYCTYQFNAATLQEGCHLALCCDECKMSSSSFICSIWQLSCLTNMAHVYLFYLNIILRIRIRSYLRSLEHTARKGCFTHALNTNKY